MFLVMEHIHPKEGQKDAILSALRNREIIKEQPGFYNLSISTEMDSNMIVVLGSWEDKSYWEKWEASAERKELDDPDEADIESSESHFLYIVEDYKMDQ